MTPSKSPLSSAWCRQRQVVCEWPLLITSVKTWFLSAASLLTPSCRPCHFLLFARSAAVITVTALLNIIFEVAAVPMTPFFLGLSPLLIYYLTSGLLSKHVKLYHPAFLSLLSKFSLLLSKFSLSPLIISSEGKSKNYTVFLQRWPCIYGEKSYSNSLVS